MQQMTVQFGDWVPDDDRNINPGVPGAAQNAMTATLDLAKNVIFTGSSWRLYKPLKAAGGTMGNTPQDAIAVDNSGVVETYVASDNGRIYQIIAGTTSDVSKAGGYTTSSDWSFTQFGDWLIATDGVDAPQAWTLGTSTLFADLAGSPPKGYVVGIVRDFVVLGHTTDGDGEHPYRVHWSGLSNATSWPTPLTQDARASQSGYQDLYSKYGKVTKIIEGEEYGLVFQERGIVRMTYVGGDIVFQFYTFERKRGLLHPRAAAQMGNIVFFRSADGFYATDGSTVNPIGYGKVNRWFESECADMSKIRCAIDTSMQTVWWAFPSTVSGGNDRVIIYNFAEGKWSYAEDNTVCLFESLSASEHVPQAFTQSHVLGSFAGVQSNGEIQTKAFMLSPGSHSTALTARILADDAGQVAIASTESDDDLQVFSDYASRQRRSRKATMRSTGYFHAFKVKLGNNTSYAQGIEVEYAMRGRL